MGNRIIQFIERREAMKWIFSTESAPIPDGMYSARYLRAIQGELIASGEREKEFRQEAQLCNNEPPQIGDSRVMPTGTRRQNGVSQPRSSDTGT